MKKTTIFTLSILVLLAIYLAACSSNNESDIPENAALVIVGNVEQEIGWLEESIRDMETMEVESTNNQGETDSYTGVSIKSLLEMAGVKPEAVSIVFLADDGSSSGEIPVTDVLACQNCIVSFRTKGGFSIVAPDLGKDAQIKGIVRLEVK